MESFRFVPVEVSNWKDLEVLFEGRGGHITAGAWFGGTWTRALNGPKRKTRKNRLKVMLI